MNATGSKSKLFGMTCVILNPRDRSQMADLAELDAESSKKPWAAAKYREELTNPLVDCYGVIGPDKSLIASAMIRKSDVAATLTDIIVHPNYRKIGVGRMLLNCVRKKCLDADRKCLEAVVNDANLGVHNFLKACKLRAVEVIPGKKHDYYVFRIYKEGTEA